MDMSEVVNGVVLSKACKVKEDEDSTSSKTVTVRVKFDGVKLSDIFEKAMGQVIIQVQAKLRKTYASLASGSTLDVNFSAPTRSSVDPKEAVKAMLQDMSAEQQLEWIKANLGLK